VLIEKVTLCLIFFKKIDGVSLDMQRAVSARRADFMARRAITSTLKMAVKTRSQTF
jgi:hypothetical protein